jgi:hypothetical protein
MRAFLVVLCDLQSEELLAHECLHKLIEFQETVGAGDARDFVVLLNLVGLNALMPDDERHGLSNVDALFDGSQMVG